MEKTFTNYLEERIEYTEGVKEILAEIKEKVKGLPKDAMKDLASFLDAKLTDSSENAFGDKK